MESVLRYGLPVNFQAMVLLPQKKTQKKLRDVLNQQYIHLDSPGGGSSADVSFLNFGLLVSKCKCIMQKKEKRLLLGNNVIFVATHYIL